MAQKYLDMVKASEYLCLAKTTLYNYINKGKVPFFRIGDRILFDMDDLDNWIDNLKKSGKNKCQ
jgi:excisionase family DNA binding protein